MTTRYTAHGTVDKWDKRPAYVKTNWQFEDSARASRSARIMTFVGLMAVIGIVSTIAWYVL